VAFRGSLYLSPISKVKQGQKRGAGKHGKINKISALQAIGKGGSSLEDGATAILNKAFLAE